MASTHVIAIEWCLIVLTLLLVSLRIFLTLRHPSNSRQNRLQLTDYFILSACLFFLAQVSMDTVLANLGYLDTKIIVNKPFSPQTALATATATTTALKIQFAENVVYLFIVYTIKISILLFLHQVLFTTSSKKQQRKGLRIALRAVFVFTVLGWVVSTLLELFSVSPVASQWTVGEGHMWPRDMVATWIVLPIFHVGSEVAIFILPFFILRSLNLQRTQKLGIAFIYILGFIAITLSEVLFVVNLFDFSKRTTTLIASFEQTLAIAVACCLAYSPLIADKTSLVKAKETNEDNINMQEEEGELEGEDEGVAMSNNNGTERTETLVSEKRKTANGGNDWLALYGDRLREVDGNV